MLTNASRDVKRVRASSLATVLGLVALFVALGATTYAAINLPATCVGTEQLKNAAVTNGN